ncbi:TonB-dependent receptor [Paraglaciecola sp. T6c]|uniref:TonB-dependent receptor n=1 Tax=Pseudoalteromonas atlantica (strain T6c / ATCC BAA-1087) TaxID=3042615 RepID=UPI00005C572E|nr:TonB-dependent receptor [Paraglaciecola sp. T6c]ABG38907.1 TonB-dependent receptor [Paraglaciecola sp. T6c]
MKAQFKLLLLATSIASVFNPLSLNAQEKSTDTKQEITETEESQGIEVIMVSATKRSESVQDIPLSVTAFSQQQLDIKGASSLTGIQESTPNLNFSVQSAGQNVARVTLRGVGTETLVGGGDPGVALHIDGIYVGRNSAAAADVFDVDRLEVLRGPQGTLYGRNATGGSVNIITKKPTDELEGSADLTYGNYNEARVRGVINVPLSDNLYSRITMLSESHDGYIKNLYEGGRDVDDKDSQSGRAQLLYLADSGDEYLLRGYYSKTGGAGPGSQYLGTDINTENGYPSAYLIGVSSAGVGGAVLADAFGLATTATGDSVLPLPTDLHEVRKDAPEFTDTLIQGIDFDASINLSDTLLLKSITSYQTNDNQILVDADSSELPLETRNRNNMAKQYSQEFNLISQTLGPFQWILGAYYYHEELTERFEVITPSGLVPIDTQLGEGAVAGGGGITQLRIASHEVDSTALFAQLSYELNDEWSVTGGLRYTRDEKTQSREIGGQVDITNNVQFLSGDIGPLGPDSGTTSFTEPTYRISTDYELSPDNLLFASYAHGYKSGGYDLNGGEVTDEGEQVPYEPEFVNAIEIGSKNKFFNNKMILNLTAFRYDYEDLQVFRLLATGPVTDNAAQSTIQGVELELKIEPTDNVKFDGSVGYLDATYDEYSIDIPPTDFSGNRLNYAPEWTGHMGAEYVKTIGEGDLITRVDWSYRSDTYFDRANTDLDMQEAYSLFNARVRYDTEKYYIDLWAKNLTNEDYVTGQVINPPFTCGCRTVNVGAPRTYGVTVGARF